MSLLVELTTVKPVAVTSLFLLRLINTTSVKIVCFLFYSLLAVLGLRCSALGLRRRVQAFSSCSKQGLHKAQ